MAADDTPLQEQEQEEVSDADSDGGADSAEGNFVVALSEDQFGTLVEVLGWIAAAAALSGGAALGAAIGGAPWRD